MKNLAIIGSGDLGIQIAHLAAQSENYTVAGFFDDYLEEGTFRNGQPILGKIETIEELFENKIFDEILIGIGYHHLIFRLELYERLRMKVPFGKIIHPSCVIDKTVSIGEGTIIYPGTIIEMNAEIGNNCLIYNGCNISHDSKIGSNSIFSPGVNIAGFCKVGSSVNLGIGTVVSDNLSITDGTRTGAGAVVISNLNDPGLYVGIPAKRIIS